MIQRIQSIYLALAGIVSIALPFVFSLYADSEGNAVWAKDDPVIIGLFTLIAVLSFIIIFLYKKRQNQFVLGRLTIILNFVLLGVLVYRSQIISGGTAVLEKGIGMIIPLISIVLLALANKAIKRDEDLVKSVDRLR
ncbi:hypothetical protein GCM10011344_43890 [Dokdonia pacifica]|uniref:Transcription termination factor Rho n=1 Tax=Dokdonia pacifica TaxID=1627892 RepID=A0A239CJZ6_9FLAO|nr:DUF4293 domain-containing protein [Dokdonia pacifica]GGG38274.1 hypothetical protein GCM10011344_43890 [Dokdonia pacifica]SNS19794.1 protein of unknown function [Dokdonia pacifica]